MCNYFPATHYLMINFYEFILKYFSTHPSWDQLGGTSLVQAGADADVVRCDDAGEVHEFTHQVQLISVQIKVNVGASESITLKAVTLSTGLQLISSRSRGADPTDLKLQDLSAIKCQPRREERVLSSLFPLLSFSIICTEQHCRILH